MTTTSILVGLGGSGYKVSNSLRFRSSASAYLNRTPSVAGNQQIFTWSGWVKRGTLTSAGGTIWGVRQLSTSTPYWYFSFNSSTDILALDAGAVAALYTTQVFRDPSAWYHIVYAVDTTQATAANRIKLYVNGAQVTAFGTANYPAQNANTGVNTTILHTIGNTTNGAGSYTNYFDGYLAEVNFIDGQALTPSSFGTYDTNGVWQPIKYSGSFGTNGFYLNFGNTTSTTTLGYDTSGNSNNWTTNNVSLTAGTTYDSMLDSPTTAIGTSYGIGNYCVLNPVAPNPSTTASTITDGNLTASASAANTMRKGTFGINSGAWYFEATLGATIQGLGLGEANVNSFGTNSATVGARTYYLYNTSTIYSILPGADTGITSGIASGGTLAVAVDYTNSKLWLGYAASGAGSITWVGGGNPSTGTTPTYTFPAGTQTLYPLALTNGPSLFANFGQRAFTYTPPTGFNALNTYNLPTPTISNGAQYMAATTYTGTGATQTISDGGNNTIGTTFQPDLVWIKSRSAATNNNLFDVLRGTTAYLISNSTATEATNANTLTAFGSTGFTVGSDASAIGVNVNAATYVGWQWKANGAGSSNTNGSITSTVSANTTAGFSIVTATLPNSSAPQTIGHGLGVAPNFFILKYRSQASAWSVYHSSVGNTGRLDLSSTGAVSTSSTYWNNTSPTSSVITLGSNFLPDASSNTVVIYCFSAVSGYSAFGSYTGTGANPGPFVYLGFRPRWIMFKNSSAAGTPWVMLDTSRDTYNQFVPNSLQAESSAAEATTNTWQIDALSNGMSIRNTSSTLNGSTNTIIYAAFAENPFQNSRAR